MDFFGYNGMLIVIYELYMGFIWIFMGMNGYLWVCMEIYRYIGCVWVYMASIYGKNTFDNEFWTPKLPIWCSDFSVTYES